MLFDDQYKTIKNTSEGVYRDKGSKFLSFAYPFQKEEQLKEIIAKLKSEHPKANHHCYAYRLTPDRSIFRANDDGEPSGTAGRPILNTLLSKDLTNILIIVVRYFGGTLLGVSGLINAYKQATEEALNKAEVIYKTVQDVYQIKFEYPLMNDVMKIIKDEVLDNFNQEFDLSCKIEIAINKSEVIRIIGKLEMLTPIKLKYLQTI